MTKHYSISNLSKISGIEIQTIRVWEKRYKIFTPKRGPTNLRQYSYQDYIQMVLVSFLINRNFRIGKIVELTSLELRKKVREELLAQSKDYPEMRAMTKQLLQGDINSFADYLLQCLSDISPDEFILKALIPLINNLNVIDYVDESNIGNRLIVNNIIQKYLIIVAENKLQNGLHNNNILILRGDNAVSTNLFIVHFLAAVKKYKSDIFLNLVAEDCIGLLGKKLKPDIVYTEFNKSKSLSDICNSLDKIDSAFPKAKIVVSGKSMQKFKNKTPNWIYVVDDLETLYKSL